MASFLPRQIVTRLSGVIGGSVPPSGNHPVQSPFTGGARPRVPIGVGAGLPSSDLKVGPSGRAGAVVTQHKQVTIGALQIRSTPFGSR